MAGRIRSLPREILDWSIQSILEHDDNDLFSRPFEFTVFEDCLGTAPIDYPKKAWLLRRLSHIGAPGAIDLVVDDFDSFVPIVGEAARYLSLAGENWSGEWTELGDRILANAERPISRRSAYVEMVLYGLFAARGELDHFGDLVAPNTSHTTAVGQAS